MLESREATVGAASEVANDIAEGDLVYLEPKTYERRSVPMSRTLADDMAEHVLGRPSDPDASGCASLICLRRQGASRRSHPAVAGTRVFNHTEIPPSPPAPSPTSGLVVDPSVVPVRGLSTSVDELSQVVGGLAVDGAAGLGVVVEQDVGSVALAFGDDRDGEAGVEEFG